MVVCGARPARVGGQPESQPDQQHRLRGGRDQRDRGPPRHRGSSPRGDRVPSRASGCDRAATRLPMRRPPSSSGGRTRRRRRPGWDSAPGPRRCGRADARWTSSRPRFARESDTATASSERRLGAGRERLQVGADHHLHDLLEGGPRLPAQLPLRLRRVRDQLLDIRRARQVGIDPDVIVGLQADAGEGGFDEIPDRVGDARADDVVVRVPAAGASATSPRRTPSRSPSHGGRPGCPAPAHPPGRA